MQQTPMVTVTVMKMIHRGRAVLAGVEKVEEVGGVALAGVGGAVVWIARA